MSSERTISRTILYIVIAALALAWVSDARADEARTWTITSTCSLQNETPIVIQVTVLSSEGNRTWATKQAHRFFDTACKRYSIRELDEFTMYVKKYFKGRVGLPHSAVITSIEIVESPF